MTVGRTILVTNDSDTGNDNNNTICTFYSDVALKPSTDSKVIKSQSVAVRGELHRLADLLNQEQQRLSASRSASHSLEIPGAAIPQPN